MGKIDEIVITLGLVGLGYALIKTPTTRKAIWNYTTKAARDWSRREILNQYGTEWRAYWELT